MTRIALLLLSALCARASETIEIHREGPAWQLTIIGVLPAQPLAKVAAMGDVTIRGRRARDIRYTLTQKLVAPDEASVRRIAAFYRVQIGPGQLAFPQPAAVRLDIPRSTRFLAVSSLGGTIDVADLDGSLRADAEAGRIQLDRISGDVEIHSNGGPASLGSIGGLVRCHSGGGSIRAVRINGMAYFETGGGDIQLGEVRGQITALTAAGGIHIERAGGQVFADTLGGPIAVLRALGMVVANSLAGPIDIGEAPSVQCRSAGGAIRLTNASGSLRASTERGSIVAEILAGSSLSDSFLSTRSGDITVLIPSNMGVTIEAENNGSPLRQPIVSDFSGLKIQARRSHTVALGGINGGGPRLRLTGSGGRIEIKRK